MKKMIVASTSTLYGSGYLEYLEAELPKLFNGIKQVLFIPFARPGGISYNAYTQMAASKFQKLGIELKGIHEYDDIKKALGNAEGIFTGGGNTFVLVRELYKTNIMNALRLKIEQGIPYLGTSAGSNICGVSMQTTNDMPIVYPPTYETLNVLPFNINPHYLDPDPLSKHKGETREIRIKEFHAFNDTPVIGLREGSWLDVQGTTIALKGDLSARVFKKGMEPFEIEALKELNSIL